MKSNRRTYILFSCVLCLLSCILIPETCVNAQNNSFKKLSNEIEGLKTDNTMKHASYGILIKNLSTGKVVSETNPDLSLIPASVMKVPVTAAALSILGSSNRFTTSLYYSGSIGKDGTLDGDIYIKGGGDPTFGSARFGAEFTTDSIFSVWFKAIKVAGIKKVTGAVVADASIFDDELIPRAWLWDDMGNYYGAGACGLNIDENVYTVTFQPAAKEGDIAKVLSFQPELSYMNIINKVTTGKPDSGDNVIIYGSPYSINRTFEGTVPAGKATFEVKGSMPDPSYFCAYAFHYFLIEKGIICDARPTTARMLSLQKSYTKPSVTILSAHLSPTLETIINITNIHSINSFAEAILRMTGFISLKDGSTSAGIKAVKNFWKSKKVDPDGFVMNDGSGLSPTDRITAKQLVSMLEYIAKDNSISASFMNSLPVAGVSGSIKDNFKGSYAENNLRAKSGYMNNVRAYTGYVTDRKGDQLAFAILINNYDYTPKALKSKIEAILIRAAELE